ncbi:MAG TPA: MFS transporter [Actinoplanes sp.]|nr:MFS transporter [Actinoplanes sp.]
MPSGAFNAVLRRPGVLRPASGAVIASLPIGMINLAVLLLVQRSEGGFAAAGLAVGMLGAGTAIGMVVQGRLIDRLGQTRVLLTAVAVQALAIGGLVLAGGSGVLAAVLACAFLTGACEPQVNASLRALWPTLVPPALLPTAMTASSVMFEAPVLLGPLLLTAALPVIGPASALLLCATLFTTGAVLLATSPPSLAWRPSRPFHSSRFSRASRPEPAMTPHHPQATGNPPPPASASTAGHVQAAGRGGGAGRTATVDRAGRRPVVVAGALASAGVRTALIAAAGHGLLLGMVQVSAAAILTDHAGLMYAAISAGSLIGAVALGTRLQGGRPALRMAGLILLCGVAVGLAALTTSPALFAAALFVFGLGLGPTGVLKFSLAGRSAPPGRTVEAFTMIAAASVSAIAAGSTLAGSLADRAGPTAALITAAVLALAATAALISRAPQPPAPR